MKYSFTCPLAGCAHVMTVEARNDDEAADKLTEKAKEHLAHTHPDITKTDIEVKNDVRSQMVAVDINTSNKTVM